MSSLGHLQSSSRTMSFASECSLLSFKLVLIYIIFGRTSSQNRTQQLHVRLLVVFNTLISQCIAWVRFLLWSMKHFNVMTPGLPFMPIRTCTDGGLEFWHHMVKSCNFHLLKFFVGSLSSLLCHIWAFWTLNFGVSFQHCTRSSNDARSRGQPSGSARPGRDVSPRRSHRSLSPLSPPVSSRCVFHKRKCRQHKSLHLDECLTSLRICNRAWHDTPSKKGLRKSIYKSEPSFSMCSKTSRAIFHSWFFSQAVIAEL